MQHHRRLLIGSILVAALAALAAAGCSSSGDGSSAVTAAPAEAQKAFCADLGDAIAALDTYAQVFTTNPVTVGDVQGAATTLEASRATVEASASRLADSITAANTIAQATAGTGAVEATTTTVLASQSAQDHIDAINAAERELNRTIDGVDSSTPVAEAAVELQAAAFGVEQAYGSLFVDAGCLATNAAAAETVRAYVVGLQEDLTTLGFYSGPIDGLYGPATVAGVKSLQASAGLPQTGVVDPATQRALNAQLAGRGTQQSLNIAALQGALSAAGFYTGAIDGIWSDELESALRAFQTSENLPVTGAIDPATLAALLALGSANDTTTTTTASPSTTAPAVSSTSTTA